MQATNVMAKPGVPVPASKGATIAKEPVVLVPHSKGATAEEAFALATQNGMRVLSNAEVDKILIDSDEWSKIGDKWRKLMSAFPVRTGTITAYEEPGKALGKSVEFEFEGITRVFPVPAKWQGEKNVALVVEHPHFTIKVDGNRRTIIADDEHVSPVRNFPARNGRYATDANHKIPSGEAVDSSSADARHLKRRTGAMVGPVVRSFEGVDNWDDVLLNVVPLFRCGVVAEGKPAGEAGTPEKTAGLKMTREADGKLVIESSKEEIDQAVEWLNRRELRQE